jgi:cytochrome P450
MAEWHAIAKDLRENDPVLLVEAVNWEPFFALTRHADVLEVSRRSDLFINTDRSAPGPEFQYQMMEAMGIQMPKSLVQMNGREHIEHRKVANDWFKPAAVKSRQPTIDEIADQFIDRLADFGGECDFAKDIAAPFTLRIIMSIFGVPQEDEPLMLQLTQGLFGAADPEYLGDLSDPFAMITGTIDRFKNYFEALTEERRLHPTDDLATVLANGSIDGQPLGERELLWYYIIVATAGHDTTSYALSGGLEQLLLDHRQWDLLVANPDLAGTAAEESIRWASPVRSFFRYPVEDTEIRGVHIPKDFPVLISYPSANRDAEVFTEPDRFTIERTDADKTLAFGLGVHYCLGSQFARREVRTLLSKLSERVSSIELAGDAEYCPAHFVSGVKHLPVKYTLK